MWGAITGTLSNQTDLQTALNAKESTANKGVINGYASLDGSGLVPSSQLPSYVDDVVEYANLAALPVTGVTGKIYVTLDTNKSYRWSGSAYVEVSPTLPAGSNTQIQFNNSGVLGGSANLTWDGATLMALAVKASNGTGNGFGLGDGYWFIDREGVAGNNGAMRFQGKLFSVHGDVAAFKFVDFSNTVLTSINTTGQFNITPLALASAQATSALNIAQTWNTTGAPTAIKLNVTNAASSVNSRVIDLQLDASSVFYVTRSGTGVFTGYLYGGSALGITSKSLITSPINGNFRLTNSAESDFGLLQFGGTTSSFPSIKRNGTAINIRLADDSADAPVTMGALTSSGNVTLNGGSVRFNTGTVVDWTGRSAILTPSDGVIQISNNAQNNFSLLRLGGSSSSYPALKRSSATIQVRLADDSDFAAVQSLYQRFGSGSPEGVVTAPVGAIYHRTDGGAGTSFYVKESGVSNTGWIAK